MLFCHSNQIEIVWISLPAFDITKSGFTLYCFIDSLDEISNPELSLKILGHPWYWTYEISDFGFCSKAQSLKYSSYMLTDETLKEARVLSAF